MESARRASEIHKRRTGKALRVTEADVLNEEMYEEEDDLPASVAYGLGSSSFELRLRMQAYWEQQLALRNAMSIAAAGGNLNSTPQNPITLRDYYQRFAQQYPLSLTSNQYVFPPTQIPTNPQLKNTFSSSTIASPTSPSMSSHSGSPVKSPVSGANPRRLSISTAPYSVSNSQRSRRSAEQSMTQAKLTSPVPVIVKPEPIEYTKPQPTLDLYTAQPFQPSIYPFTTQLPTHMQQYHLADFIDPTPIVPIQSVPLDTGSDESAADIFSANDWTSFLGQTQTSTKITSFEDGTNWDDFLNGDASWLLGPQPEHEQKS